MRLLQINVLLMVVLPLLLPTTQATHDPNDFFTTEATFTGVTWADIHGTDANNVWAIGHNVGQTSTVIARRIAGTWTLQTVPAADPDGAENIRLWAQSTTNIYAVIGTSTVLKWNGAVWGTITAPFAVDYVWGTSATNILFASDTSEQIVTYNGASFGTPAACASGRVTAALHSEGVNIAVLHGIPNGVHTVELNGCSNVGGLLSGALVDMWNPDATIANRFVVGRFGEIYRDTTPEPAPADILFNGVTGVSATDMWAVGLSIFGVGGTAIIHRGSGTPAWTVEPTTVSGELMAVWCATSTECWLVVNTGVIQKLLVNPATAVPNLTGFTYDPDDLHITASQGQCLGDDSMFTINIQPPLGVGSVLHGYVIDENGIVTEHLPAAMWTNYQNRAFKISRVYPAGDYALLVTIENAIGTDPFMLVGFTVQNSCAIDGADPLVPIILDHVRYNQAQENRTYDNILQVHTRVNTTFLHTNNLLNNVFGRLNTTCQKTPSADGCESITFECAVCNVTVNNTEVLTELETLDTEIGGAIYAFLWLAIVALLAIWAYLDGHYIPHVIAIVGCLFTVIWLPEEGLGGLRVLVIAAGIGLAVMGWRSYKNEGSDVE